MQVNRDTLLKYLYENMKRENTLLHSDGIPSIRLEGFTFKISYNKIEYEKHGTMDSIKYTNEELDLIHDKALNFYSRIDLNSELNQIIRNSKIDDITD